jgi:hypothetical protein
MLRSLVGVSVVALSVVSNLRSPAQGQMTDCGAGLTAVAAELKLLRSTAEKASESQIQVQAIGIYLANEQARLAQMTSRLDSIRHELDAASAEMTAASTQASGMEKRLQDTTLPSEFRSQLEAGFRSTKQEADLRTEKVNQLRLREADALQALRGDQDQWAAMVARLQQIVGK